MSLRSLSYPGEKQLFAGVEQLQHHAYGGEQADFLERLVRSYEKASAIDRRKRGSSHGRKGILRWIGRIRRKRKKTIAPLRERLNTGRRMNTW